MFSLTPATRKEICDVVILTIKNGFTNMLLISNTDAQVQ